MNTERDDRPLRAVPPGEGGDAPQGDDPSAAPSADERPRLERFGVLKKKGIYIVPSLITSAAFFCGFYAVVASMRGDYYTASWVLLLAMFLDGMDGRVARLTGATSNFGVELDSLSDLMTFGVAPAIMLYHWVLQPFGKIGWMAAFLYALCGALRLARFNTQVGEVKNNRFVGLPIPMAAALMATTVLMTQGVIGESRAPGWLMVAVVYLTALLMVSNIPYRSFKDVKLGKGASFPALIGVILTVFVVVQFPHAMLFGLAVLYTLHGPVEWGWATRNRPLRARLLDLAGIRDESLKGEGRAD